MQTRRQAALLFNKLQPHLKPYKTADKRKLWEQVFHASKQAVYFGGVVRYSRHPQRSSRILLQVIDAACQAGLLKNHKSPPGSPKISRLLPLRQLASYTESDPWEFDPRRDNQLVFLRDRQTGDDLPFNPKNSIPARVQSRLELVNKINSLSRISYDAYDPLSKKTCSRQLRPIHYAIFHDEFDLHGRIYTGKYGHQGLTKIERHTICFDDESSVELDYSALHPRMVYHLEGIDFQDDPYQLWGRDTTPDQRLLAKITLNSAINATGRNAAVAACNCKLRLKTSNDDYRQPQVIQKAKKLSRALENSGQRFQQIYDLALKHHKNVGHYFRTGIGRRLMTIDAQIALEVLYHFAKQSIPCLGVHDSFIVPEHAKNELREIMIRSCERLLHYCPIVN